MKFDEAPIHGASDQSTRERVARSILVDGPSTAAALAERLELTPAAVRRHLEVLVEEGAVEARESRQKSRRRGRPARVFALTDQGREGFDQQYDDLAVAALRYLSETAGDEGVREFAARRAAFIKQGFETVAARDASLSPAEVLAQVFTAAGYAASVKDVPELGGSMGEQLCQQHCPVSHVAHEFPQLCEAETEAIGKVLGTHVQRLATIAHGDGVCTTHIPLTRGADPGRPGAGPPTTTKSTSSTTKKEQVTT